MMMVTDYNEDKEAIDFRMSHTITHEYHRYLEYIVILLYEMSFCSIVVNSIYH